MNNYKDEMFAKAHEILPPAERIDREFPDVPKNTPTLALEEELSQICPRCGGEKDYRSKTCKSCSKVAENNPAWKGEDAGSTAMRKRGRYLKTEDEDRPTACELCGKEVGESIIRHHIDQDQSNNVAENYMWLCRSCHFRIHNPNFGDIKQFNDYELNVFLSSDNKNTVHIKANNAFAIKRGVKAGMELYDLLISTYGTKQQQNVETYDKPKEDSKPCPNCGGRLLEGKSPKVIAKCENNKWSIKEKKNVGTCDYIVWAQK